MLSSHSLLVAAIFTTYMASMAGLFAYIIRTGRHREEEQRDRDDGEPEPAAALLAA